MTPAPSLEHQRILADLVEFLRPRLRQSGRGSLISGVHVVRETGPSLDFRIPDLSFVAVGREHVLAADGIRGDGPDAVIEIRSPEDETYDKLAFYAAIGVKDVIVCQRDSKDVELFRLAGSQSLAVQADADGWLMTTVLGIRLRRVGDTPPRLRLEDLADPASVEI